LSYTLGGPKQGGTLKRTPPKPRKSFRKTCEPQRFGYQGGTNALINLVAFVFKDYFLLVNWFDIF